MSTTLTVLSGTGVFGTLMFRRKKNYQCLKVCEILVGEMLNRRNHTLKAHTHILIL